MLEPQIANLIASIACVCVCVCVCGSGMLYVMGTKCPTKMAISKILVGTFFGSHEEVNNTELSFLKI